MYNSLNYFSSVNVGNHSDDKEEEKQSLTARQIVIRGLVVAICAAYYCLLLFGSRFFDGASVFYRSLNPFSGAGNPDKLIRIASYCILFLSMAWIAKRVLNFLITALSSRKMGVAVAALLENFIQYAAVIALFLMCLNTMGVDTMGIVAGLGVLSLIIGMGAQELISDILAGIFIVFEKLYDVGDVVVINDFRGMVRTIGIRDTQIEDAGGNVMVVNNSKIETLVNLTHEKSVAVCSLPINYNDPLAEIKAYLLPRLPEIGKSIPELLEGPIYTGISGHDEYGLFISFIASCEENAKYRVEQAMADAIKVSLEKSGINCMLVPEKDG